MAVVKYNKLSNLNVCWLLIRHGLSPWSPEIRKIKKENKNFLINMLVFESTKNKRPNLKLH